MVQGRRSGTDLSIHNTLIPDFSLAHMNRIKRSLLQWKAQNGGAYNALRIKDIASLHIQQLADMWKVEDVPGDENCWIYATIVSLYYASSKTIRIDAQNCRNKNF